MIRLYGALPKTSEAQVIGMQLSRSGTSVGTLSGSNSCPVRCRIHRQD
ncbi:MAG: hypothetical protein R3B96_12220 [Pirellulaceae bacterium]